MVLLLDVVTQTDIPVHGMVHPKSLLSEDDVLVVLVA